MSDIGIPNVPAITTKEYVERCDDLRRTFAARAVGHCAYWRGSDKGEIAKQVFIEELTKDEAEYSAARKVLDDKWKSGMSG